MNLKTTLYKIITFFIFILCSRSFSTFDKQQLSASSKCYVPDCVFREGFLHHSNRSEKDNDAAGEGNSSSQRDKRSILTEIKKASSKKIDTSSDRLASSFSQGFIDLGSRDPREEGAATLAFVFDTTGSMYDDLRQVIDGAGKILRTVLEKFERPIHNYVLVPFNDPKIGKMTVTSDPEEFKSSLHDLQYYIHGGGDCPEMAVGAIKMALESCLPSSYIYVFTDARAKDYYLLDKVLTLIQKKHTQVVFVMTGDCGNRTHPGYKAFETIASTSSGQVFHLNKSDVDEVLNFVRLSLESRKVNLLSVDRQINEPGEENLELLVDKTLREFTISVAGQKPSIEIYRPEGPYDFEKEDRVDELLNLENVKIVGVKEPTPGRYNISVGSESKYTVRATGLSSIDFQTGFSLRPTTNIKETYHRPMKGGVSHVLVKPIDETEFGDLFRLQLLSLNGEVLEDIPLERLPGKDALFRGTNIEAPDVPFNIKIFGRDRDGYDFERISPTAVSSQLPFPPEVVTREKEEGFYDRPVIISCHVQTLVPFNITWKKDGEEIDPTRPYPQSAEVIYVIKKPTSADEGIYTCLASNIAGSSFGNVILDMKEPPPDISVYGNFSLTPGRQGILRCDVTSTVAFNVTWSRYIVQGQVQDFFGRVETVGEFLPVTEIDAKFKILPNNSLLIDEVTPEDNGWYRCGAANEGGHRAKEVFLEVQAPPEVTVTPTKGTFKGGGNITMKCNARGIPPPTIYWAKDNAYLPGDDARFSIDENFVLRIENAGIDDEGTYICLAENPAGRVQETVTMTYVEPPRLIVVNENILAESGSTATLHCHAQGIPQPNIRWFKADSTEVLPMSFIEIEEGNLRISGVQESDAGTYTCVASNGVGTAEDQVTLSIGSAPTVLQPPVDNTIEVGGTGGLSCYGVGIPPPSIKWQRKEGQPLPQHFVQDKSGALRVNGMKIEDEGTYMCILENQYGRKEIEARLSVSGLLPPLIAAPPNPHISVVASESVTLPCTVVMATPSPTITWYFKGKPIELKEGMFVTREGDLRIPFAKKGSEGKYRCEATNVAGNSSLNLFLNILEPPKLREGRQQEKVKSLEGDRVRLRCPVGGDPKPTYSWQKNGELVQPFQRRIRIGPEGTLYIRAVKYSDGGVYVCTAINPAGATNTAVTLTVLVPPYIENDPDIYTVVDGAEVRLPCRVRGSPSPTVTWTRPENYSLDLNSSSSADGSLRVIASVHSQGIYQCHVTNEAGSATRSVSLVVNKAPEIHPSGEETLSVVAGEALKLPCKVTGHPKPRVIWTRDNSEIVSTDSVQVFNGYLLLKNVSPGMRGSYTCKAVNREGADSKTIHLTVNYPPVIRSDVRNSNLNKDLIEGSEVSLPCPGAGYPIPSRSWTKNGKPLRAEDGVFLEPTGTVEIVGTRREHSGIYQCTLSNSLGTANLTYHVNIMVPPKVSQDKEKPQVVEGDDITIKCPVDAFPIPSIEWLKDGITIFSTKDRADVTHVIVEDNGQTLHIFEATMDDQGTYRCIVRNSAGESSKDFPLRVLIPPQFTTFLHNPIVVGREGEEVVLDCSVDGDPDPKVEWKRNDFKLPALYPQVSADGHVIRIAKVTQSDAGFYTCKATNTAGLASRNFNLTVYALPTIDNFPGHGDRDQVIAVKGQDRSVQCKVTGTPVPTIMWSFGHVPLEKVTDLSFSLQENNQILTLHTMSPDHSGVYICNASNAIGTTQKIFNISVFTPPHLYGVDEYVTEVEEIKVVTEETLRLSCEGGGFPAPTYSWFWKNRPLTPSLMSYQAKDHELILNRIKAENRGTYTCLAVNPAGTAEKHFNVDVQVPPQIGSGGPDSWRNPQQGPTVHESIVNSSFTLYCPASGIPDPTISWSKDGEGLDILWEKILIENTTLTNVTMVEGRSSEESQQSVLRKVWSGRVRPSDHGRRLTVEAATSEDSGVYTCTAENEAGKASKNVVVSVLAPPKIVRSTPSPILIPEGSPLRLYCAFEGSPEPLPTWLINGADLQTAPLEGVFINELSENESSVLINDVGREHIGTYTCLVSSIAGTDETSFDVSVATPPVAEGMTDGGPQTIITRANRPVSFHCRVDAYPPPQFEWFKNDYPIDTYEEKFHLNFDESVLKLVKTTLEDSGNYSCEASNSAGSASIDFTLEIHVPPHLEEVVVEELTVEEGQTTQLFCPVTASPTPSVLWMKGATILHQTFTSSKPRYLVIENATRDDHGRYICLATNEAGTLEQSFTVNVLVPPKLENQNKALLEESVILNRQVTISCFIVAEPLLDIEWRKNGSPLSILKPGLSIDVTGRRLTIAQAQQEDAGNYTCTASNPAGEINITTILKVLIPPMWSQDTLEEEEVIAVQGIEMDLECLVKGSPVPSILWLKDGQFLEKKSHNVIQLDSGRILKILKPSDQDSGLYTCIASNVAGTLERRVKLSVHTPPFLIYNPVTKTEVLKNRAVTFDCPVQGRPEPEISWLMEGETLNEKSNFIQLSNRRRHLHVLRVSGNGSVTFSCLATNSVGKLVTDFLVDVFTLPVIKPSPTDSQINVVEGHKLSLSCKVEGYPVPQVVWVTEKGTLIDYEEAYSKGMTLSEDGTKIVFLEIRGDQQGKYICLASNKGGNAEYSFDVVINLPPVIEDPYEGTTVAVSQSLPATLKCDVDSRPEAVITWRKDGENLSVSEDPFLYLTQRNQRLKFLHALSRHEGRYKCIAENPAGRDELEFLLRVMSPPTILEDSEPIVEAEIGDNFHLECQVNGNPRPELKWQKGDFALRVSERHILSNANQLLQVINATVKDSGFYFCTASSETGNAERKFDVRIYESPSIASVLTTEQKAILGRSHTLTCEATGNPQPIISWTKRGSALHRLSDTHVQISRNGTELHIPRIKESDGGYYTCIAASLGGQDSKTFLLTVVVPPKIESANQPSFVTGIAKKWVELVCEAFANPPPKVTWFKSEHRLRDGDDERFQISPRGERLRISNLAESDSGDYMCEAENEAGVDMRNLTVKVIVPPIISEDAEAKIRATGGSNVVIQCPITANPTPSFSWSSNSIPIGDQAKGNMQLRDGGRALSIVRVSRSDAGTYICTAWNSAGSVHHAIELEILVPPLITGGSELEPEEEILKVIEGGRVTFDCNLDQGYPPPMKHWLRGIDLQPVNNTIVNGGNGMVISKATRHDSDSYQCVAENEVGIAFKFFKLIVQTSPKINVSDLIERGMIIEENAEASSSLPPDGRPRQSSIKVSVSAIAGSTLTIHCPIQGTPDPHILWYKGSHAILPSSRIVVDPSKVNITIAHVMTQDGGSFSCVGVNPAGEAQLSITLLVEGPPTLEGDAYEDKYVVSGQTLVMECRATRSSTRSLLRGPHRQQQLNIAWKRNGNDLPQELVHPANGISSGTLIEGNSTEDVNRTIEFYVSNYIEDGYPDFTAETSKYILSRDRTRLSIPRVREDLGGDYACVVSNRAGKVEKTFKVHILEPPTIDTLEEIRTFEAAVGEPVVFECNASGQPPPEVTWYKGQTPVAPSSRHQFLESSHVLIVTSVQETDAGEYLCFASNTVGLSVETFTLYVLVPPTLKGPVEERTEVVSGRPVKMDCEMEGLPQPKIIWSFDNKILIESDDIRFEEDSLLVNRVTPDFAGEYICDGTNSVGRSFKVIHLIVKEAPCITGNHQTEIVTVIEGNPASLHCVSSGHPLPSLHWEKDGVGIRLDSRVSVSWGGRTLVIQRVSEDDSGRYTCTASNSAGNDTKHYRLNVLRPPKIEDAPSEVVAVEGEVIAVFCSITGNPSPKISWHFDGAEITERMREKEASEEEEFNAEVETVLDKPARGLLDSGALQFSPILLSHAGNYTCAADNEAGRATHNFPISVLTPPTVELELSPAVATTGESAEFRCTVKGSSPITFSWMKDRVPLPPGQEYQIGLNGILKLPVVTSDMAGVYTCSARNPAGVDEDSQPLLVHELPQVTAVNKEVIVASGQETELECRAQGLPPPSITWSRPDLAGREITPESSRIQVLGNRLVIAPVISEDMGTYQCTGTNRAGSDSANLALVVTSVPAILEELDEEITVLLGESVNLGCTSTSGYPPPSIIWRKEGKLLRGSLRVHLATNGEILIDNIQAEDSGMYSCLVVNAAGRLYRVVHVVVQVPPRLTLLPRTQQVTRGDSLTLTCEAAGVPTPTISWLLNGTEVEGVSFSEGGRGRLQIQRVAKSDEGTYTCVARNTAGHRKAVAGVKVKVPPVIMNSPGEMTVQELSAVMLTCLVEGDPSPATTWTKEGHYIASSDRVHLMSNGSLMIDSSKGSDSGLYKCVASNDAGAAEAISHLRVTTPPRIIRGPVSQDVEVGQTVLFDCEAEGEPRPELQWTVSPGELNERYKTLTNGSLQLVAVQFEDEGEVICQVFNELGEDLAKANLTVRVPGMWSEWGSWTSCSSSCGTGEQIRKRFCDSPPPRNGGKQCEGEDMSSRPCRLQACPVDGGWSLWDSWNECSVTCGEGTKMRRRICNSPAPLYGGRSCEGREIEKKSCKARECPVNGSWSEWSEWSSCSRSCGEALRQRTRICNNPPPYAGGEDCKGDGLEVMPCGGTPCRIDGEWGSWSEWSSCSASCDEGIKYQRRSCDNPASENGGSDCQGEDTKQEACQERECVIHGHWSSWSSWDHCSVTCGIGRRQRTRSCNNPEPQGGGIFCRGSRAESRPCRTPKCPVHGNWGSWSEWSSCSRTCGLGVRQRTRRCNNPYPRNGGMPCSDSNTETMACEDLSCRDLPLRVYGSLRGWLNGQDLGVISLSGNVTTNGNQRTLVISLSPLLPQFATWLTPLVSVISSAIWTSAYESNGALNGNTLTKSTFTRESHVAFKSGERVDISQTARGVDESGTLRFNVEVNGDVPYLQPGSFVTVQPFSEDYVQTGKGSLFVKSTRTFAISGYHHSYTWNETVDYDTSSGLMPFLMQTLHANSVSASYRCLSGIEGSNTRGELSFMISSVIMPSENGNSCPDGFTYSNDNGRTPLCKDNDECTQGITHCSHYCKNVIGGYSCECPRGYEIGSDAITCQDIDECSSTSYSCGPREQCQNTPGSYACIYSCRPGFKRTKSGTACEDVNECEEENVCEQKCQNFLGSYRCDCYRGFTLSPNGRCEDIDECKLYGSPCSHDCVNVPGSFKCSCPSGYLLLNNGRCKDIDECATFQHNCTEDQTCQNFNGGFHCVVNCPYGLRLTANGSCVDIDECAESTAGCHYTQKCDNMWGRYRCSCQRGFKSMGPGHPCVDINECHSSPPPCSYECRNLMGDYECICPPGSRRLRDRKTCIASYQYSEEPRGAHTYHSHPQVRQRPPLPGYSSHEYQHRLLRRVYKVAKCPKGLYHEGNECVDLNECSKPGRCQHKCENTYGSYYCSCPRGYKLKEDQQNCKDINECKKVKHNCKDNQICFNMKGSYECVDFSCPDGYVAGKSNGYCQMDCEKDGNKCPSGVQKWHIIIHKWLSISSGTVPFEDLAEFSGVDEENNFIPHSEFTIEKGDFDGVFKVKQKNGKGILSSTKMLEPGKKYALTMDAKSLDGARNSVIYSSRFLIILHISQFPY